MKPEVTLTFLGDISLNDNYRIHAQNQTDLFAEVIPVLKKSDLVIGNLEAMADAEIHDFPFPKTRLQTDINALKYLKELNIGMVTLANNHVYDNLESGYSKTISFLEENGIQHVGTKQIGTNNSFHTVVEQKGMRIAFLNYVHPSTNPKIPENSSIILSEYNKGTIINDIQEFKKNAGIVILMLHWGMEDSFYPEPWQINDARAFHHAGANVIVGHHTHTLQGYQKKNNNLVFYSLGNFCFSPLKVNNKVYEIDLNRHTESVILHVKIAKDRSISFNWVPIRIVDDHVKISGPKTSSRFVRRSRRIMIFKHFYWAYKLYLLTFHKIKSYFFMNGRSPVKQLKSLNLSKLIRFVKQQKSIAKHG